MGYSLSWIAIKGRSDLEIHQLLDLKKTGKLGDYSKHRIVGRALKDGWYILIANGCDDPITKSKLLALLSKRCEALTCSIEEHVMFSSCAFWKNGKKVWSVKHRGEEGPLDITKAGKLPESYAVVERELIEAQKAEDEVNGGVDHLFDVPLVLAKQLVGFRHDEESPEIEDGTYEILELSARQRIGRAIKATLPWLYIVGVIVAVGLALAAIKWFIDWLFESVKDFVS